MNLYNCVMLGITNPILPRLYMKITNDYSKYINLSKVAESRWKGLVEDTPHITLFYGLNPGLGRHKLYFNLIFNWREYYLGLATKKIELMHPKIDTFDNEDCRVLKINFDSCDKFACLEGINEKLSGYPNTNVYKEYEPHCTLTYLNQDAPDSIMEELNDEFSKYLTNFSITEFILSSDDETVSNINIPI